MKRKPSRYWFNLIFAALLSLALFGLTGTLAFTSQWAKFMLHPARIPATGDLLQARQIPFEDVLLHTKDGLKLSAWYTPPQNEAVILIAHGFNDNRIEAMHVLFAENGYGALSFDFRAHGLSEGELSTLGYHERLDVEAALDFVLAQEGVERVGAWGGSMGAATLILSAAAHPRIEAVIADSAYPSLEDVLRLNMPIAFFQPFVMFWGEYYSGAEIDSVNPELEIGKISPRPVFVIDGWEGGAAIMNSPHRLYEAANEPKEIWVEQGVPHLGMYANEPEEYERRMFRFFDEWLLGE